MEAAAIMELRKPLWLNMADPTALRGRFRSEVSGDRATRPPGGMLNCTATTTWGPHVERAVKAPA
jgi:hypothetical protein